MVAAVGVHLVHRVHALVHRHESRAVSAPVAHLGAHDLAHSGVIGGASAPVAAAMAPAVAVGEDEHVVLFVPNAQRPSQVSGHDPAAQLRFPPLVGVHPEETFRRRDDVPVDRIVENKQLRVGITVIEFLHLRIIDVRVIGGRRIVAGSRVGRHQEIQAGHLAVNDRQRILREKAFDREDRIRITGGLRELESQRSQSFLGNVKILEILILAVAAELHQSSVLQKSERKNVLFAKAHNVRQTLFPAEQASASLYFKRQWPGAHHTLRTARCHGPESNFQTFPYRAAVNVEGSFFALAVVFRDNAVLYFLLPELDVVEIASLQTALNFENVTQRGSESESRQLHILVRRLNFQKIRVRKQKLDMLPLAVEKRLDARQSVPGRIITEIRTVNFRFDIVPARLPEPYDRNGTQANDGALVRQRFRISDVKIESDPLLFPGSHGKTSGKLRLPRHLHGALAIREPGGHAEIIGGVRHLRIGHKNAIRRAPAVLAVQRPKRRLLKIINADLRENGKRQRKERQIKKFPHHISPNRVKQSIHTFILTFI